MAQDMVGFDIHVHGEVPLRDDVTPSQIEEALKPLWLYAGAKSLARGAVSSFEEEPGIRVDPKDKVLQVCWTVAGSEDFRQALDEACMGLNELSREGAALEVSFYDTDFDEDEADDEDESRDDFFVVFVGPTPAAILQVQRDLLVHDVAHLMSRHFDESELGGVVAAVDELFESRFNAMVGAMDIQKIMRGPSAGPSAGGGSHGGGRKPRHLH